MFCCYNFLTRTNRILWLLELQRWVALSVCYLSICLLVRPCGLLLSACVCYLKPFVYFFFTLVVSFVVTLVFVLFVSRNFHFFLVLSRLVLWNKIIILLSLVLVRLALFNVAELFVTTDAFQNATKSSLFSAF